MTGMLATLGSTALWLLYLWLGSAIVASWLSERKGYGPGPGLACGVLLSAIGVVIWLVWPSRARLDRFRGEVRRAADDRPDTPEP